MLIIVASICTFIVFFTSLMRRKSFPISLSLMYAMNLLHVICIVLYIAIMSGLASRSIRILFLDQAIMKWMHVLPINLYRLGYITAIARLMVPYLLLLTALALSMNGKIRLHKRKVQILASLPTILLILLYEPRIYRWIIRWEIHSLSLLVRLAYAWILLELLFALYVILREYFEITVPIFRKNFLYIVIAIVAETLVYLIFATKDPAQIYNLFITEYINLGISNYISPTLSNFGWSVILCLELAGTLIGSWGIVRYEHFQYSEERVYATLEKQFTAADMGISVFAHGLKNQLLSVQVLHKRMKRELAKEEADLEQIRRLEGQIFELNEAMRARIEDYYRAINSRSLVLSPVDARDLLHLALEKFHEKYPQVAIETSDESDRKVLADPALLSEAIYNLLTNGYEATLETGREAKVRLELREERMWTVFSIIDNGSGIAKEQRRKIFQPFFTSKNKNESWGMGLFYTNRIVRQHMGLLRLESRLGEGSRFLIMLPALPEKKNHGSGTRDQ